MSWLKCTWRIRYTLASNLEVKIGIEQRAHKRFRDSILKGSGLLSHCFMQNERLKRGGLRKRTPAFLGRKKFMYLNKFSMIFYVGIKQRAHKRFRDSILKGSGLLSHCFMQNERLKRGGLRKRTPAFLGRKKFSMIFYVQDSGLKIISKNY
jgi:hypothetical protein